MPITPEVLDQILKDYEKPEDLLSENGLLQQLTKALVERALNGEMTHQLQWNNKVGWHFDVQKVRQRHPGLINFEQFLKKRPTA